MHINGAFDSHVHFAPHAKVKANTDALTLVSLARKHNMAGLVLKCNCFPSVGIAYLAGLTCPDVKIYGGIVINPQIGGLNYTAVKSAIAYGEGENGKYCRFVCLPTFFSARDIEYHKKNETAIELVKSHKVVDELKRILDLVAEHSLVLMSGHVGSKEIFQVVEQARRQGVKNIVICHPSSPVIDLTLTEQKQLAGLGAIMQQCCVETYPYFEKKYGVPGPSFDDLAKAIRYVGVESCILASDMGADSGVNPDPVTGFADYIDQMDRLGFTEAELRYMAAEKPRQLFTDGLQ